MEKVEVKYQKTKIAGRLYLIQTWAKSNYQINIK